MNAVRRGFLTSLLLHTVCGLAVFWISMEMEPEVRPPVALDLSILAGSSGGEPGPGPAAESSGSAPAAPTQAAPAPEPERIEPVRPKKVVHQAEPVKPKKKPPQPVQPTRKVAAAPPAPKPAASPSTAASSQPAATQVGGGAPAVSSGSGVPGGQGRSGGGSGRIYGAGQLDRPLVAVRQQAPTYPGSARRRNIEGWVKVQFVVNEQGKVVRVHVLDAQPKGVFEQSTVLSIRRWRFHPGTVNGVAVSAMVEQTITFKLQT
ncbi:MAG: energy transducer TonB [Desulfobulbus sp.]|jgi:protein TonB